MRKVNIGLVGCGTVGSGVVKGLARNGALMGSRLGVRFSLGGVAVRNPRKARAARLSRGLVTSDWESLVRDPKIDVVMELMGGTTTARKVVAEALKLGKPVITANKALISAHGESIFRLVEKNGGNLYYEASVAGGIPIIKAVREVNQSLGLREAKEVVESAPAPILEAVTKEEAEAAQKTLEEAGAKVVIK